MSTTYSALLTPQRMIPGETYAVAVTVTNRTNRVWKKSDFVLSYHWKLWDGTDYTRPGNRIETALPADLPPGQSVTLDAKVKSPIDIDLGNQREAFVLDWDMRDRRAGKWLSETDNIPTLTQQVTVEFPTSNQLGLEKFYTYGGVNSGTGWTTMVNQFSGNAVVGYNAFANPGRGLSTFARLTYNSLDNSNSYAGRGWSLSTSSLARLGSPLQFHRSLLSDANYPDKITLIDGDGTSHRFELNKHGTGDRAKWTYDSPAGVHTLLQRDPNGGWVMTRPDRTRILFDSAGHQTAVVDKNDNKLLLHYQNSTWGNRNTGVLTHVTDPAGRRVLTLDYYQQGDDFFSFAGNVKVFGHNLLNTSIINQLRSITDVSGRRLTFTYGEHGQLREIADGADTQAQKTFMFFYDDAGRLVRVNDALGHGTQLVYQKGRIATLVDRRSQSMGFHYVDGTSITTDAKGHRWTTVIDGYGRPVKRTNAKNEVTELAWDDDNNVRVLKENNGAVSTWVYDGKTGFPLEIRDAEANAHNHPPTRLSYRTSLNGYVADLVEKTSPEGRKWIFGHDGRGNLTSVTDPKGTATPDPNDFTTRHSYDQFGQLVSSTDANGHTTRFGDYDPVGYPRRTIDAVGCATTLEYDVTGNVVASTDAKQKTSTFTYDIFSRPLTAKVPKDAAKGEYITIIGPVYDKNDNIVISTAPNGAVSTASYDAADQIVAVTTPKDDPKDPVKLSTFEYDAVGNLIRQTQPKGNLTSDPNDFVAIYTYDELNRPVANADADGNRTTFAYDDVGNVVTLVDPRKNATDDPSDHTSKYSYDLNHRVTRVIDALGHTTGREYDRDSNVVATTDQDGNKTLVSLDERAMAREIRVPHRVDTGQTVYRTTRYEYDAVGNRTKTITPRGVETQDDPNDFAHEVVYDQLNRIKEQLTPFDDGHSRVKTPDRTLYSYDAAGQLAEVSAPPSAGQAARNVTRYTYFDNGRVRTSTDPWNITTGYEYNDIGKQTGMTMTAAGGSTGRTMRWDYHPDGKLKSRFDDGVPGGKDVLLVDNHDQATEVVGNWGTAGSGEGHEGHDYRLHAAGTGTETFTWNVDVPRNGTYEVFVRYAPTATATDASYTVEHEGGRETKTVDQTQQAGQWVSLGSFGYTEDRVRKIVLSDNANGTVVADALRLVRDSSGEVDNEQKRFDYRYDPNDNLVELSDSSSEAKIDRYRVEYNGLSQVKKIDELKDAVLKASTGYTYDPNGNPLTRTHNAQNAVYTYDVRDQLATVTNTDTTPGATAKVHTYTYNKRAQRDREVKANGNTVEYQYFLNGQLRTEVEKKPDGKVVNEHTLEYNANGHRTRDVSRKMNADDSSAYLNHTYTYTFDPRDRVEKVVKADSGNGNELETETYEHDANNNVVKQAVGGKTTVSRYDRNRLVSSTVDDVVSVLAYDPLGRLDKITTKNKLVEKYRYDGFDRVVEHQKLKQGSDTERVTTRFAYDPMDRTTTRVENPGPAEKKTDFAYLGLSGEVLTEQLNGKLDKSFQYSPTRERLSQTKHNADGGKEESFYGYNPHTDVEVLTDEKGDTRATYGYTAYGQNDEESFTGIDKPAPADPAKEAYNPYRFNAKRFDNTTGDYDMGFRNYDPGRNTFLSRDMYNGALADLSLATDPFTGNRHAFAGGNPISGVELDGHAICADDQCQYVCPGSCTNEQAAALSERMARDQEPVVTDHGGGVVTVQVDGKTYLNGVELHRSAPPLSELIPAVQRELNDKGHDHYYLRSPDDPEWTPEGHRFGTFSAFMGACENNDDLCSSHFMLEISARRMGVEPANDSEGAAATAMVVAGIIAGVGGGRGFVGRGGGLKDLGRMRSQLGLPAAGPGSPTLARLDVGGRSFYGISAHGQPVNLKVNAITKTHAEADVFQQAANANLRGGRATLYVDHPGGLCRACGANGGVASMARQLGITEVTVVTPFGRHVITP